MLTPHGDPLGRIGEPDIGGQCVYIRELAKHLSFKGIDVRVFTRDRGEGKPETESFAETASVIRISCGPKGFVPKEEILPLLSEFANRISDQIRGDEIYITRACINIKLVSRTERYNRFLISLRIDCYCAYT